MVPLSRTLYYTLGSDVPVFPSLRSSQLASQPVMLDCLRATLHLLHLGSYVALERLMFGLCAVISQPPLFFLCPPTVDVVDLLHDSFFPHHLYIPYKHFTLHICIFRSFPSVETSDQWKCSSHLEPPTFTFLTSETICRSLSCSCCPLLNENIILAQQTFFCSCSAATQRRWRGAGQRSVIPDNVDNVGGKVSTRLIRALLLRRTAEKIRLIQNRCRSIRQSGVCKLIGGLTCSEPPHGVRKHLAELPVPTGGTRRPAASTKSAWKMSRSQWPLYWLSEISTLQPN